MKTITIKVTKQDIECGIKDSCDTCPVAIAIIRKTKHKSYVYSDIIYVLSQKMLYGITPILVHRFISNFDAGLMVKPFSFKLKLNRPI